MAKSTGVMAAVGGSKRTSTSRRPQAQTDEQTLTTDYDPAQTSTAFLKNRSSNIVASKLNVKKELNDVVTLDDMDVEVLSSRPVKRRGRPAVSTQVLKAVAIPTPDSKTAFYRNRNMFPSHSPVSTASLSSARERSSGYDTPGTSLAVTPAESTIKGELLFRVPPKPSSTAPFGRIKSRLGSSLVRGKRKRTGTMEGSMEIDIVDSDARLASALQAEEYDEDAVIQSKPINRRRRRVQDSEDDIIGISDVLSDSDGDGSIEADQRKIKKIKVDSRLPTRAARDSARKSIAQKASLGIADTEDSDLSAESEYLSELDSMDFDDESDDGADLLQPNDIATAAAITAAPGTAPSANGAHIPRRRGRNRTRHLNRYEQHWSGRAAKERHKLEKAHPEVKTLWTNLEKVEKIIPEKATQPEGISRKLKSFQLEGLNWMMRQEKSQWKGGLLGDEMGMGKTIQAVSLIMSDYPAKEPTLVVVPPVALMQWQNEIKEYTDGKLKVLVYHNTNPKVKTLKMKDLKSYDVIMISYSGLESIYRKESKGWKRDDGLVKENSLIHAITFHRLILDEAHNIKSRTTGVAKACFALKADYKWCLSGTPVQNRIGEFFSLLRFLEVKPFACYFCKACACAELHWSQDMATKKCTHCKHSGFNHVSIFNQEILNPITQADDPDLRRQALDKLRLVTDRIMLRRLKRDHTASMELPPKEVVIHNEFFGEIERDFSSSIMSNTTRQFDTYVSRGVMLNNYANIFGLIMQMRQVANHPDLILKKHAQGGQNVLVCCICDETAEEPIKSKCHHEFCRKCVKDYVRSFEDAASGTPDCPRCHIPLSIDFDQPDIEQDEDHVKKSSIINRIKMEDWTSSTKIEMLVYDLYKLRSSKETLKTIVFSQFTSMLQLVEWRLRRAGFNTVMLDGSMSPAQRQKSIEYFMNNTNVEVFLVSLKAGGVALNLVEASRVFIIDPWWNPAAEWQSADRCHRIGQKRPCVVTRLCVEDSVESRMIMLQEKKANMINGTINNDQVAMEKLTPEDMQFLFRGT